MKRASAIQTAIVMFGLGLTLIGCSSPAKPLVTPTTVAPPVVTSVAPITVAPEVTGKSGIVETEAHDGYRTYIHYAIVLDKAPQGTFTLSFAGDAVVSSPDFKFVVTDTLGVKSLTASTTIKADTSAKWSLDTKDNTARLILAVIDTGTSVVGVPVTHIDGTTTNYGALH